jgi:protein-L-isoaspartate(D-aspartate) O-methyltransferase
MHAHAAQALLPSLNPGSRVLDVGSGSGYLTHVLARLVAPNGKVIGIEHIKPLAEKARENMSKSSEGKELLESGQVEFVVGDGRKGWSEGAPYDAIHVGAAAAGWHEELTEQLGKPGQMFIPVEERGSQYIWMVEKDKDGNVSKKKMFGVQYVPLTDAPR